MEPGRIWPHLQSPAAREVVKAGRCFVCIKMAYYRPLYVIKHISLSISMHFKKSDDGLRRRVACCGSTRSLLHLLDHC